jgi:hypothetical protein
MARGGNLLIQFGKITIAGDGSTTIKDLEETLGRILREHGYPEEMRLPEVQQRAEIKLDTKTREPTMDEIEILAKKLKHD